MKLKSRRLGSAKRRMTSANDTDKHERAEDVGEQHVQIANDAKARKRKLIKAVDGIEQIDEQIERKPVEDERVEEADDRARTKSPALRERRDERVDRSTRQVVQPSVGIAASSLDAEVQTIETIQANAARNRGENEKGDTLRDGEHGVPCLFRS